MNACDDTMTTEPWDKERIKTELRRRGWTLAKLDRAHGYAAGHFSHALTQPLRKAEAIIADVLDVPASTLWPSRYGPDGRPHQGRFLPSEESCSIGVVRQVSESPT